MKNLTITIILPIFCFTSSIAQTMKTYTSTAKGSFSVKVTPVGQTTKSGDFVLGTYSVEKVFEGDMKGSSKFEMHSTGIDNTTGAYVAIEPVTATLNGKTGTFLLMHNGSMTKTSQELAITVVPGCSTGELKGLEGKFTINMVGKEHYYVFEYSL